MPTVNQQSAPSSLTLNDFRAASDNAGQFAKSCRFVVMINPPQSLKSVMPNDLHLMCDAVELPGRGFNVTEVRYYGPSMVFPNNTMYGGTANLSFICRSNSPERFFFDEWMDLINPTNTFNFAYPNQYWTTVEIFQLAEYGLQGRNNTLQKEVQHPSNMAPAVTYRWTMHNVWPTLVNPQQVTWTDNDILRLQVSFAYKYWDRPNVSK
jgi:hypothetical protein